MRWRSGRSGVLLRTEILRYLRRPRRLGQNRTGWIAKVTKIEGPYYRTGHYIRGKNERVVAMVDCWDQHGAAERDALIADLIDVLTARDAERDREARNLVDRLKGRTEI